MDDLSPRLLAGIALAVLAIFLIRRMFSRAPEAKYTTPALCGACGWSGSVSRFKGKCPRCGAAM